MYIIRLVRRVGDKNDPPVTVWLTSTVPLRWGRREVALEFLNEETAWRVASALHVKGAWSVEEA
jgi:hypothetical protein